MRIESVLSSYQGFLGIKLRLERLARNLLSTLASLYPSVLETRVLIIYKHSMAQKMGRYRRREKRKEEGREVDKDKKEINDK